MVSRSPSSDSWLSTDATYERPTSGSIDDASLQFDPPEDSDRYSRQLHLRRNRFKAPSLGSSLTLSNSGIDVSSSPNSHKSPAMESHYESSPERRSSQHDCGPLQDISNASLRRRTRQKMENQRKETSRTETVSSQRERDASASPNPAKAERTRSAKATPSRRLVSTGETSKYIEHLESQLVSLQTQLSTLTSPSTTKTQSTKLRAMNTEAKMLRQELAEWEDKFHERLRDQINEHKRMVDNLQHQIRNLEMDVEQNGTRVQELEAEIKDKTSKMTAAEKANYDLERRLEFMSELLATSPNKIELHPDAPQQAQRRQPRPKSMGPPRLPSLNALFSPRRQSNNTSPVRGSIGPPETPSPQVGSQSYEGFPFEPSTMSEKRAARAESTSDLSESTYVNSMDSPYARDTPLLHQMHLEKDAKSRPPRRMRRFYAGSMGPRSLILPATTSAGSNAPPIQEVTTPKSVSVSMDALGITSTESEASNNTPDMPRRRSSSWHANHRGKHVRQQSSLSSISVAGDRTSFYSVVPVSNRNSVIITAQDQPTLLPPFETSKTNSLFDELSRARQESESDEAESTHSRQASRSSSQAVQLAAATVSTGEPSQPVPLLESQLNATARSTSTPLGGMMSDVQLMLDLPERHDPLVASNKRYHEVPRQPITLAAHTLSQYEDDPNQDTRSVKSVFSNAWSRTMFSRPILAFRLWLVRLLLGDLKRKAFICAGECARTGKVPSTICFDIEKAHPCNACAGGAVQDEEFKNTTLHGHNNKNLYYGQQERKVADDGQNKRGLSPLTSWLKFSMTLIFAVGLAIKDGPNALYMPADGR